MAGLYLVGVAGRAGIKHGTADVRYTELGAYAVLPMFGSVHGFADSDAVAIRTTPILTSKETSYYDILIDLPG
jgi:hypothetical protein